MTYAHTERRVTKLESRATDIEEGYGESIYKVTRPVAKAEVVMERGSGLILERLGVPATDIARIAVASEAEVDATSAAVA